MLQVNFTMICMIHNISLLFESNKISKRFLRSIIDFYFFFFLNNNFFLQNMKMKSSRLEEYKNIEEHIIKDPRNLFRLKNLKKEENDAAIKGIRNYF